METVNGEWIMLGCDRDDPTILKNAEAAVSLVHKIGFLPLFSNSISGFSVEEHVPADGWWSGDEVTDPWKWRMILARRPDIAYGKFFGRSAGFISRDFFPMFANYRRNGYDFDSLYEDGKASRRAKKIMDVLEPDEEARGRSLMSFEIKALAGFGKAGGEKNFDGVLTELQMQTYLLLSDFRQKKNKKGESYGWHIAVVETPETKWGRSFVTSEYSDDPEASWQKIQAQVRMHFPEAEEKGIQKVLGIRKL